MQSILVPIDAERSQAPLGLALLVARMFAGHVDGLYPRTLIEAALYGEGFATTIQDWEHKEDVRAQEAGKRFRAFMEESGVAWGETAEPGKEPSSGWVGDTDRGATVVGQLARLYDVTVLAQPGPHASSGYYALLESVLFESGRPILLAPEGTTDSFAQTVVIAWNGSTESARTIALSQAYLRRAEQVHILSIEGGMIAGPTAHQVQSSLRRSGIPSEVHVVAEDRRSTGEAILEETAKLGGDLLIKGAYTHSRLRQMIFGGATTHILREAKIPVLMAH